MTHNYDGGECEAAIAEFVEAELDDRERRERAVRELAVILNNDAIYDQLMIACGLDV